MVLCLVVIFLFLPIPEFLPHASSWVYFFLIFGGWNHVITSYSFVLGQDRLYFVQSWAFSFFSFSNCLQIIDRLPCSLLLVPTHSSFMFIAYVFPLLFVYLTSIWTFIVTIYLLSSVFFSKNPILLPSALYYWIKRFFSLYSWNVLQDFTCLSGHQLC